MRGLLLMAILLCGSAVIGRDLKILSIDMNKMASDNKVSLDQYYDAKERLVSWKEDKSADHLVIVYQQELKIFRDIDSAIYCIEESYYDSESKRFMMEDEYNNSKKIVKSINSMGTNSFGKVEFYSYYSILTWEELVKGFPNYRLFMTSNYLYKVLGIKNIEYIMVNDYLVPEKTERVLTEQMKYFNPNANIKIEKTK